jgi:hypothetical protein
MRMVLWLLFSGLFVACRLDEKTLRGEWQAVSFFENGRLRDVDLSPVQLKISEGGRYEYNSIGLYREQGSYRVSMHYLFLTDTTRRPPIDHIVKVLYLSSDSLKIRMESDSLEQVLWMARMKTDGQSVQ